MDETASQQLACFDSQAERQRRVDQARARIEEIDSHPAARMQDWIVEHGPDSSFNDYLADAHARRSRAVAELRSAADPLGMGRPPFFFMEINRQLGGFPWREYQARIEFESLSFKAQIAAMASYSNQLRNQLAGMVAFQDQVRNQLAGMAELSNQFSGVANWVNENRTLVSSASRFHKQLSLQSLYADRAFNVLSSREVIGQAFDALSGRQAMAQAFDALSGREAMDWALNTQLGFDGRAPAIVRLRHVSEHRDAIDVDEQRALELRQTIIDVESASVRDEPSGVTLWRRVVRAALVQVGRCGDLSPILALKEQGVLTADELWRVLGYANTLLQRQRSATSTAAADVLTLLADRGNADDDRLPTARPSGTEKRQQTAAARARRAEKKQGYLDRIAEDKRKGVSIMARSYASSLATELGLTVGYVRELRTKFLSGGASS